MLIWIFSYMRLLHLLLYILTGQVLAIAMGGVLLLVHILLIIFCYKKCLSGGSSGSVFKAPESKMDAEAAVPSQRPTSQKLTDDDWDRMVESETRGDRYEPPPRM